ncbi:hypothetical protein SRHO_G00191570 [Serrasalmus rhombeus]
MLAVLMPRLASPSFKKGLVLSTAARCCVINMTPRIISAALQMQAEGRIHSRRLDPGLTCSQDTGSSLKGRAAPLILQARALYVLCMGGTGGHPGLVQKSSNSGRKEDDLGAVGGRPPTGQAGASQTVLQAKRLRELGAQRSAAGEAFQCPTCSN